MLSSDIFDDNQIWIESKNFLLNTNICVNPRPPLIRVNFKKTDFKKFKNLCSTDFTQHMHKHTICTM